MVNLVTAYCSLLKWLMKRVGMRPFTVEIEPGTVIRMWVPCDDVSKPAVVLLHGFCGDGMMNWQLQVQALARDYAVYVPDLLFFGGSVTDKEERSTAFQAECVAAALGRVGVEKCAVVGFSYGGYVALKMAEMCGEVVEAVVVSGCVVGVVENVVLKWKVLVTVPVPTCCCQHLSTTLRDLSLASHTNFCPYLPNCFHRHFLQTMYSNTKERAELLESLVNSYKDISIPNIQQRIHLLWGESDKFFNQELALQMKEKLGDKATFEGIKKGGHLVHLERPCLYNSCLKHFLSSVFPLPPATK